MMDPNEAIIISGMQGVLGMKETWEQKKRRGGEDWRMGEESEEGRRESRK
jgi:hypothetical protein